MFSNKYNKNTGKFKRMGKNIHITSIVLVDG